MGTSFIYSLKQPCLTLGHGVWINAEITKGQTVCKLLSYRCTEKKRTTKSSTAERNSHGLVLNCDTGDYVLHVTMTKSQNDVAQLVRGQAVQTGIIYSRRTAEKHLGSRSFTECFLNVFTEAVFLVPHYSQKDTEKLALCLSDTQTHRHTPCCIVHPSSSQT